jgi:menaquinone-dependent protoporphyrinogen oxidase
MVRCKEKTLSSLFLVGYATRYGSTQEVAEKIAATLRECGLEAEIQPLRKVGSLVKYSGIVLGAPLFMFHWHRDALGFLTRHRRELMERPVAVFVLGPVHNPHDETEWKASQSQLDNELANYPWFKPIAIEMFGGKYDPAKLGFPLNMMTGKEPASDIRDWITIQTWAGDLAAKLITSSPKPANM